MGICQRQSSQRRSRSPPKDWKTGTPQDMIHFQNASRTLRCCLPWRAKGTEQSYQWGIKQWHVPSTNSTAGSPAQKQWLFRCCRPNYMAKPTSATTPGRLFPPIQNRWKDPPGVTERTFPWISFTAYHQVCPFQKPSPNHFKTGTPSR